MKNLIVHPKDPTTNFLSPIYASLTNKTIVRGGITKSELRELIESHDRVLMLGHGSPYGLLMENPVLGSTPFRFDKSSPLINKLYNMFALILCWLSSGLWCSIISGIGCLVDPE